MNKHNPEINKILSGCKGNAKTPKGFGTICGYKTCGKISLCNNCKSLLKGILIAQENEVEWLKSIRGTIIEENKFTFKEQEQRIKALQESNKDLKEKLI